MTNNLNSLRFGYVPLGNTFLHPFDLKNFVFYARKRGLNFEIADLKKEYDIVVLAPLADLSTWSCFPKNRTKIVYTSVDSYLSVPQFTLKGALRGFAKYVSGEHKFLRLNYAKAIKDMCKRADALICSTYEQKMDIQPYCKNVHIILEFNHQIVHAVKNDYNLGPRINLVWEGRPENMNGVKLIKDVLVNLRSRYPVSLHIITDLEYGKYMNRFGKVSTCKDIKRIFGKYYSANIVNGNDSMVYLYQWNRQTLSHIVTCCDMAVIPLDSNDSLMWGKPENKLLFFWRMGMPTVVSATAAYMRTMKRAGQSLFCKNNEEWYQSLDKLISDYEFRRAAGLGGRSIAETVYSEEEYLKKWDQLFESLLN